MENVKNIKGLLETIGSTFLVHSLELGLFSMSSRELASIAHIALDECPLKMTIKVV